MPPVDSTCSKQNTSDETREAILQSLLLASADKKLPKGQINRTAERFNVSERTVYRIWTKAKIAFKNSEHVIETKSRIKGNSGRKKQNRGIRFVKLPKFHIGSVLTLGAFRVQLPYR